MSVLVEPQRRGGAEVGTDRRALIFRSADGGDIPLLQQLADETWRASYSEMLSPEQINYMLRWMYGADKIAAEFAEGVVWQIAEIADEPVGYYSWRFEAESRRAKLNKLYVLPARQHQGCGRTMLEHAMGGAEERGAREMSLSVNKQNHRAQRLYQRAGFRIASEVVFDIGQGFVMDDFIMVRGLAEPGDTT